MRAPRMDQYGDLVQCDLYGDLYGDLEIGQIDLLVQYWNSGCLSSSKIGDAERLMNSAGSVSEFSVFLSNWCAFR